MYLNLFTKDVPFKWDSLFVICLRRFYDFDLKYAPYTRTHSPVTSLANCFSIKCFIFFVWYIHKLLSVCLNKRNFAFVLYEIHQNDEKRIVWSKYVNIKNTPFACRLVRNEARSISDCSICSMKCAKKHVL